MGVREDDRLAVTLAMPLSCQHIASEAAYFARKERDPRCPLEPFHLRAVRRRLAAQLPRPAGEGTEGVSLTLTGTSAEDSDSGQVGRGNRANGLIAFSRPTGGEATAGKNPAAHAGKVYSVLTHRLARFVHARCPALREVCLHMVVRLGEPVDRPWTGVQVVLPAGAALEHVEGEIRHVVEVELARMPAFRAELIRGEYPVC